MSDFDADPVGALDDLKQRLKRVPLTESQFAAALDPVLAALAGRGLYVTVNVADRGGSPQKTYGSSPGADLTYGTRQEERVETDTALISVVAERRSDVDSTRLRTLFTSIFEVLQPLLASHWGARDALAFVFNEAQEERFRTAVREAVSLGRAVALVGFDLDQFKQVNDTHGHPAGDDVLREFGRRLREQFAEAALVGRFGGEEFTVVWMGVTLDALVRALTAFRRQQEEVRFQAIGRANTCSMGVALFPEFVSDVGSNPYDVLDRAADDALYAAKEAGRNRIRWGSDKLATPAMEPLDASRLFEVAFNAKVFSRGDKMAQYGALQAYLFAEVQERSRLAKFEDTRAVVDQLLAEIGVDISQAKEHGRPTVSRRELVEIVATALAGNSLSGAGPTTAGSHLTLHAPGAGQEIVFDLDGVWSIALPVPTEVTAVVDFGRLWRARGTIEDGVTRYVADGLSLSPYVTIAVGAESLKCAEIDWSAATIAVDDRPVIGGGLPDFWQSNVTRAIQAILANPNARVIVVVGNETRARRTIMMLRQLVAGGGDDWRIARRLGLDPQVLREFVERNVSVQLAPATGDAFRQVVSDLVLGLGAEASLDAVGEPRAIAAEAERRARLSIVPFRDTVLGDGDGMRVATMADAYPRVIQQLRNSDQCRYSDFMGREFVELTAFKVALTHPMLDSVPDYWSDDASQLEFYHEQEFRSPAGLFGSRLQTWGDEESQITKAVNAAVEALTGGVASRRILLTAPRPSDEWRSPLGLIGASVFPRAHGDCRRLDFLWLWRTVEALVGFPFSAFGSIRESALILEGVNRALRERGEREVVCGELVYFAASLHLFVGPGDAEIARTVVRDSIR